MAQVLLYITENQESNAAGVIKYSTYSLKKIRKCIGFLGTGEMYNYNKQLCFVNGSTAVILDRFGASVKVCEYKGRRGIYTNRNYECCRANNANGYGKRYKKNSRAMYYYYYIFNIKF